MCTRSRTISASERDVLFTIDIIVVGVKKSFNCSQIVVRLAVISRVVKASNKKNLKKAEKVRFYKGLTHF